MERTASSDGLSYVYFVKCKALRSHREYLKIGYSAKVSKRIHSVRSGYSQTPEDLDYSTFQVIGIAPGSRMEEMISHAVFNPYRAHSEWFHWCTEVRDLVAGIPLKPFNPSVRKTGRPSR